MLDFCNLKFLSFTPFLMIASGTTGSSSGTWVEFAAKNGVLALCLLGLAVHTARERDKDRNDRRAESERDRAERAQEREVITKVLQEKDKMISELLRKLCEQLDDKKDK